MPHSYPQKFDASSTWRSCRKKRLLISRAGDRALIWRGVYIHIYSGSAPIVLKEISRAEPEYMPHQPCCGDPTLVAKLNRTK